MSLIRAAIVGVHPGSKELLQRRVGGILKGLAQVITCSPEEADRIDAPLLVSYAHGARQQAMLEHFHGSSRKVIGVELTLLPVAVKTLRMLDPRVRLGVLAEHQRCANYFLAEIVRAGIADFKYEVGTFDSLAQLKVDKFVVSEEMEDVVDNRLLKPGQEIILVPRTISPTSAAEIIGAALEAATT